MAWRAAAAATALACCVQAAAATSDGQALLEKNCGRCHGVTAGAASPLEKAPNLWDKLRSYPSERLDVELAEGVGSHHETMPQIQFTDEQITAIYYYLHGKAAGAKD
jgi:mono/diheme cytochrome c family protein